MIKLVACDMDGTLLDSEKRLPAGFAEMVRALKARGVRFAAASGRQYDALRRDLREVEEEILFICENGALVMERGERLLIDPIDPRELPAIVTAARGLRGVYPVLCRAGCALMEASAAPAFIEETGKYYSQNATVDSLVDYADAEDVCKVAFYDEGDAQTHELPVLRELLSDRLDVILSGEHWVDIMRRGVSKGTAMAGLQRRLGLTPAECMAFGDYLNDIELLQSAQESYAMANAHPLLKEKARHIAPSNDEDGVMRVLREVFSL